MCSGVGIFYDTVVAFELLHKLELYNKGLQCKTVQLCIARAM